jgi:hypothetical protein
MQIETAIKDAIKAGFSATIAEDVQEIVARETRRALREHEEELTLMIRTAVKVALEEALK